MGLLSTLRRAAEGGHVAPVGVPKCGQSLLEDADECPGCGAEEIACYEF